jgi:hypothetical protein
MTPHTTRAQQKPHTSTYHTGTCITAPQGEQRGTHTHMRELAVSHHIPPHKQAHRPCTHTHAHGRVWAPAHPAACSGRDVGAGGAPPTARAPLMPPAAQHPQPPARATAPSRALATARQHTPQQADNHTRTHTQTHINALLLLWGRRCCCVRAGEPERTTAAVKREAQAAHNMLLRDCQNRLVPAALRPAAAAAMRANSEDAAAARAAQHSGHTRRACQRPRAALPPAGRHRAAAGCARLRQPHASHELASTSSTSAGAHSQAHAQTQTCHRRVTGKRRNPLGVTCRAEVVQACTAA